MSGLVRHCVVWFFLLGGMTGALLAAPVTNTLVVPNLNAGSEGNDALSPFSVGGTVRLQQVYAAEQFGPMSPTGALIRGIRFREDQLGGDFDVVFTNMEFRVSTTLVGPTNMWVYFAENIGSDETVVFPAGQLHLRATGVPGGGVQPFQVEIPFATPFYYNPKYGNLLLDIARRSRASIPYFDAQFASPKPIPVAIVMNDVDYSLGSSYTLGLVTQFIYTLVPPERPVLEKPVQTPEEVRQSGFRLLVTSTQYVPCVLERSLDLSSWYPLVTNRMATPQIEFRDLDATNPAVRFYFYRVRKG